MLKKFPAILITGVLCAALPAPAIATALSPYYQSISYADESELDKVFSTYDFSILSGNSVAGTDPITLQYYDGSAFVEQDTYLRIAPGTEFSLRYDDSEEYAFIYNTLRLEVNVYDSNTNYDWDALDYELKDDGDFISYYSSGGYAGPEKRYLSAGESVTFQLPEAGYGDRSLYRVFVTIDHPKPGDQLIYGAIYDFVVDNSLGSGSAASEAPSDPVAASDTAYSTSYSILVDGQSLDFDAYALKDEAGNDTNYLKLRDIAHVLNGSQAQFNVGWDGTANAITITTGEPYASNGSEMSTPFSGDWAYTPNQASILVNGQPASLEAITLTDNHGNGYTYFKLRDLGQAVGFNVTWDGETGAIVIDTTQPYQG